MSAVDTPVGFLGLGNLGSAMALRLIDEGIDVVGADTSDARLEQLAANGGRRGDLDAVFACDVVCVATPDDSVVAGYFSGRTETPGARTVLLHSTVTPATARSLASVLSAAGVRLVEAPVSGGPDAARRGELSILLGGSPLAIGEVDDILAVLSRQRFVLGDIGAASATKLANQLMMLAAVEAAHEALDLTGRFGVEREAALAAISAATGDTWVGRHWGFFDAIVADYDAAGTPPEQRPWRKDLREFVESADAAGVAAPLARRLQETVGDRIERAARHEEEGTAS